MKKVKTVNDNAGDKSALRLKIEKHFKDMQSELGDHDAGIICIFNDGQKTVSLLHGKGNLINNGLYGSIKNPGPISTVLTLFDQYKIEVKKAEYACETIKDENLRQMVFIALLNSLDRTNNLSDSKKFVLESLTTKEGLLFKKEQRDQYDALKSALRRIK